MAFKYRYKPKSRFNAPFDLKPDYKLLAVLCVVVVIAAYFLIGSQIQQPQPTTTTTTAATTTTAPSKEKLIVAAKDVKQKLGGFGYAVVLNLTVKSIQVHAAGDNTTDSNVTAAGWITIFNGTKTFDLLEYTDVLAIIGSNELDVGKYTQIRLYISEASVKIYDSSTPSNNTYPMNIPSNVLKLIQPFTIEQNKTTVLTLDFDVPASIPLKESIVGIGLTYRFSPVVKVTESKIDAGTWPEKSTII